MKDGRVYRGLVGANPYLVDPAALAGGGEPQPRPSRLPGSTRTGRPRAEATPPN